MTGALAFTVTVIALTLPAWADLPRPDPAVAEFARGVKFTVAGYGGGAEVQTNFPVLVRLSTAIIGFDYGDFYADGSDLALVDIGFVDADGNGLPYEIDTWNTSGESLVWVSLPRMTNGTEFAMWYRSSKTGKALNPDNVWTNYVGVWHFREDYGAETASVSVYDSTTNQLTGSTIYTVGDSSGGGQQPATLAATDCSGKLGRVRRMGSNYHDNNKGKGGIDVLLGTADSAKRKAVDNLVSNFSGSFWIYGENKFRYPYYVSRKSTDSDTGWGIQSRSNKTNAETSIGFWAQSDNNGTDSQKHYDATGLNIAQKKWTKIDFVYTDEGGGGRGYLYTNGVPAGSGNLVRGPAANTDKQLYIGGGSGSDSRPLIGLMDEVRLCYSVPTAARVKADYDTVNDASFLTIGTVVTNVIIERPVVNFTIADVGASHIQFGGSLTSLGSDLATECIFYAKVWATASSEPATWTALGTDLGVGALSGLVKGLSPATAYSYKLKVTNDEGNDGVDSDETSGTFTTSGVGVSGTGGEITRIGDDWIHYFRVGIDDESGDVVDTYTFTPPSYVSTVRALVVAGGGPGGYRAGGGGGAGGYIYNAALTVSSSTDYAIHVGTGGAASKSDSSFGQQGGNSSVIGGSVNLVAIGGGAGGNGNHSDAEWRVGQSGGSGGGSSHTANAGAGTSGQGNAGGKGATGDQNTSVFFGGGGGGAGSAGDVAITTGNNVNAPNGGAGLECDITGVGLFYAGGGGAGSDELSAKAGSPGSGGSGVGGTGSRKSGGVASAATQGVDGTGSGGGGCGDDANLYKGGDGGDGIVIIRYASQGDPSTIPEPIISLQSAVYDDADDECDVTFRVAWGGYNAQTGTGYEDADVAIVWGFRKDSLSHTNSIATDAIGFGTGTFTLSEQPRTVYVRALATNDGGHGALSTEIIRIPFVNPNAPVATVSATPGITTAGFEADVTSLGGTGATRVEGVFQVCTDEYFEDGTYLTFPMTNGTLSTVGVLKGSATGLASNTIYYVRASLTNNIPAGLETEPFKFRTNSSGLPDGQIQPEVSMPEVSQSATKVSARKTVTLTASATGATSYRWLKNGEPIEGGTSGTLTVNWRSPKNDPIDTYQAVAVYLIDGLTVESEASAGMTVENQPMGTLFLILGGGSPTPPVEHDYSGDYLTFRILTPGTICWKAYGNLTKTIEYSIDNGAWTPITSTAEGATISVEKDSLVRFRGSNTAYATSKSAYSGFEGGSATYDIEGNIMSLLYGDNFSGNTDLPNSTYIFCSLFKKAPVISAEHLILPATTLKNYCYRALFSYCTTLTKAPELPATTLAQGCYWYMFERCAITEAPALNATTLVPECYGHMFEGCGLLNRITCLATSGLGASKCLEGWVTNVAGDGAFVKAANVTDWTTGVNGIPTGWIVCEDVLLLPPEISFDGETIELECGTVGAEIHYRLGQAGDFALYTQPISIVTDTVVEAYSTYQGHTSHTVTQACVYVQETPFQRSNKDLPTWRYGGNTITTPYSVNATNGHSSSYSKGTFSFDTSITLRAAQPTYLWFQHADQSADIYVNDVKVETHWGGYNAFFCDISEYVRRGKNDIRVALCNTTRNTLAPYAGDFNFNATLGNVKLFTSPVLPAMEYGYDGFHITSTVSASDATTNATIYVKTKVPVGASLKCTISDGSYAWTNTLASTGSEQTFTTTIAGNDLHLWKGTIDPHLYTVTLEIYKDGDLYHRYQRPYGFRYYEYAIDRAGILPSGNYTGFLLNGQPYQLRGVCMHDDVDGKANALDDDDYDQEFAIIQELGCNFIRLAHYPHPKEVYDRCDQLGIIVQTEVPCVNKLQSSLPADYYTHLTTQYIEMVQQHYNHPCIVFWGLSNETTTDNAEFGKGKIEGYYDLIKGLDSERMVGYVMSHSYNNPAAAYNDPKVDWFGCNIYVGWYIDKTTNNPSAQLNTRLTNTVTRLNKPLAFSEYGCGGTQHCHSDNFKSTTTTGNNPRHDIEYQMWLHEGHIAAIRNYPQLLFTGQWQLFDIAVSSRNEGFTECIDGVNATTNNVLRYLNNKGLVERDHTTKKDTFYLYKAEWSSQKFVHICGKDYTKTTGRKLKCYTNDGNSLSMYVGDSQEPIETATVVNHIAEFEETDFTPGVEIRVKGDTTTDTVTFQ